MQSTRGEASGSAWVVGDADTVRGFRLAGYAGRVAESAGEAQAALDALRIEGVALVILTERVCAALGGLGALAAGPLRPLVLVVPGATPPRIDPSPALAIAQTVRRALGMPAEPRSAAP